MKTSLYLAVVALVMAIASFLFARSAFLGGSFVMAWFALASILTGVGAVITGSSAIGRFSLVTGTADIRAQQIADASMKQITARANIAEAQSRALVEKIDE